MTQRALSRSVEDYLKAIYGLSDGGDAASTSAIADALDVQPASVTGMVKRMAETGLLEHLPYKGVRLTRRGARILETYLCEKLDFSWEDVHDEAERLEHAASDLLIEHMARALGSPSHDPHGAPIPTRSGHIEETDLATLADASPGVRLRIRAVRDEDPSDLRSMADVGLVPGVRVLVRTPLETGGTIEISLAEDESVTRSVDRELAQHIYVVSDDG